jgi:undecaprenyl-diphosphatase
MKKSLPAIAILAAFLVLCLGLDSLRAQGEYITSNPNPPPPQPPPLTGKITPRNAIVLGIVEGLTEYLPVSSTGHLILTGHWLGLVETAPDGRIVESQAVNSFNIVIQLGAILAVVGLYRRRVGQMFQGLLGQDKQGLALLAKLLIAFLPAAIVGVALHEQIKEQLFRPLPVAIALAFGGVLMIAAEIFWRRRKGPRIESIDGLTYAQAFFIGMAQVLAMWPGTSRSMITIVAALLVGMAMVPAAEFSFLLALPTLGAATVYEAYKSREIIRGQIGSAIMVIGLAVSFMVAMLAIRAFVKWLTKHGMIPFGVYRILLAGAVLYFLLMA